MLGAPPVRLCRFPGSLQLPADKRGTLLLNDVDALSLRDQIALYDWLGSGAGNLRVISVTTSNLAPPAARGAFLEGLFHRPARCSSTSRPGRTHGEHDWNPASIRGRKPRGAEDPERPGARSAATSGS
jgi:hypothetical protein